MQLELMAAVIVVANLLGASMALPQAARIFTTHRISGVSAVWAAMSVAVNAWWGVYGLGVGNLAITPVSFVSAAGYAYICFALVRFRRVALTEQLARLGGGAAIAIVPLAALIGDGWELTGLVLGLLYAVQLTPAVVEVYRAVDVSGVSAATWALAWTEALLWGIYGLHYADTGLLALSGAGVIWSTLVLARLLLRRRRHGIHRESSPVALPV